IRPGEGTPHQPLSGHPESKAMTVLKVIGDLAIVLALIATAISLQLLNKTVRALSSDVLAVRADIARLEAEPARSPPGGPGGPRVGPGARSSQHADRTVVSQQVLRGGRSVGSLFCLFFFVSASEARAPSGSLSPTLRRSARTIRPGRKHLMHISQPFYYYRFFY